MIHPRRHALLARRTGHGCGTAALSPGSATPAARSKRPAGRDRRRRLADWRLPRRPGRELAPQIEVILLERASEFIPCPFRNRWRIDQIVLNDARLPVTTTAPARRAAGYTVIIPARSPPSIANVATAVVAGQRHAGLRH